VSESWFPLPFPECAGCGLAWVQTKHRNCRLDGDTEIEPWQGKVRCIGCQESWLLSTSTFYCRCGRSFTAVEAKSAVEEVVRATRSLYEELILRREELADLRQRNEASFNIWLGTVAKVIGGAAGYLVGRVMRGLFGLPF
jgi:hypothetical protein